MRLHLQALVWDLFFFFFFSGWPWSLEGPQGPSVQSTQCFSESARYALFTFVRWIQGTIPATLSAAGVVRITQGPFHQRASKSCFQPLTHTCPPSVSS